MLRKLFGWMKPAPPSLPVADRPATQAQSRPVSRVVDVTDEDFAAQVLARPGLVVVDFWADWCQPCTILSAHTEHLAQVYADHLRVAALDVDENPNTAEEYTILGLPTLLFIRDGEEVDRQVGLLSFEELRAKVDALLP